MNSPMKLCIDACFRPLLFIFIFFPSSSSFLFSYSSPPSNLFYVLPVSQTAFAVSIDSTRHSDPLSHHLYAFFLYIPPYSFYVFSYFYFFIFRRLFLTPLSQCGSETIWHGDTVGVGDARAWPPSICSFSYPSFCRIICVCSRKSKKTMEKK